MKKLLSLALTLALLSTLCIPVFAAAGPVTVKDADATVTPEGAGVYTIEDTTDGEINGMVTIDARNATGSTLEVTVENNVTAVDGNGVTVYSTDSVETNVVVNGDIVLGAGSLYEAFGTFDYGGEVNATIEGDAEGAWGVFVRTAGEVEVIGDVTGSSTGMNVSNKGATVFVEGDLTGGNYALYVNSAVSVAIDGETTGEIHVKDDVTADSIIAIGSVDKETALSGAAPNVLRFLIGTDDDSEATLDDVTLSGSAVSDKTLKGINDRKFGTTLTMVELSDHLTNAEVKLSAGSRKLSSVSGLGNGITATDNGDGTFTLKLALGGGFMGGLNKLILKLATEPDPDPAPLPPKPPKGPVHVITALPVEGVEGVDVKDDGGHVFLCIAANQAGEWGTDVKVTLNGEEVDPANYTVVLNPNGSVSLAFASSYLLSLGAGEHVFTVTVGSESFDLTVIVKEI